MTRTVNSDVKYSREYVIAAKLRRGHLAIMDAKYLNRRERLTLFFQMHMPLSRNAICKRAEVSESAVGAFLRASGDKVPRTLAITTYEKLAAWSYWTVAELTAEAPVPTPDDIASRKSSNRSGTSSDFFTNSRHSVTGTPDGPESEADMGDRILLEILDKMLELPPGHLQRLKRHLEAIEGRQVPPRKAGTAE